MESSTSRYVRSVTINLNINDLIRDMLKFILMENFPISIADDLGNISIIKQGFKAFGITFNRHNAKEFILKAADQIYQMIAKDIGNSYPSLIFESATRYNKNVYLGNIRYISKYGSICNRTLGLLKQHGDTFGAVPVDQLAALIQKVGKTPDDIYSTCSGQRLNHVTVHADSDLSSESENEEPENQQDGISVNVINETVGMLHTKIFCGTQEYESAIKEVTEPFESKLQEIRKFAKNAMSQKHDKLFKTLKRPRKDTIPGWNSTYLMISDFNENSTAYKAIPYTRAFPLRLMDDTWSFIEEYAKVFGPVHSAVNDFQKEDYTMSDFYLRWMLMEIQIGKIPDGAYNLQSKLLNALRHRSKEFFEYDAFTAALVLDPRFAWDNPNHTILNDAVRTRGAAHIAKIHQRLIAIQQLENPDPEPRKFKNAQERILAELLGFTTGGSSQDCDRSVDINQQITNFIFTEPRAAITKDFNILQYWSWKQYEYRALYKISQVVYSAAFSQVKGVSDSRCFSMIYSHLRTCLADETLNAILVIKQNLDLFDEVKFF